MSDSDSSSNFDEPSGEFAVCYLPSGSHHKKKKKKPTASEAATASPASSYGLEKNGNSRNNRQGSAARSVLLTQNIWQTPLKVIPDFVPPVFDHTEEQVALLKKALKKNVVCGGLSKKELKPLIKAFEPCHYKAKETIITQGEPGDYFYVIVSGKVDFIVNKKNVGHAGKGKSFGELALMYTCPRAATVKAHRESTLFRVDQHTFRHIVQNQVKGAQQEQVALLKRVQIFADLTSYDLHKLAKVMKARAFEKDD